MQHDIGGKHSERNVRVNSNVHIRKPSMVRELRYVYGLFSNKY